MLAMSFRDIIAEVQNLTQDEKRQTPRVARTRSL